MLRRTTDTSLEKGDPLLLYIHLTWWQFLPRTKCHTHRFAVRRDGMRKFKNIKTWNCDYCLHLQPNEIFFSSKQPSRNQEVSICFPAFQMCFPAREPDFKFPRDSDFISDILCRCFDAFVIYAHGACLHVTWTKCLVLVRSFRTSK